MKTDAARDGLTAGASPVLDVTARPVDPPRRLAGALQSPYAVGFLTLLIYGAWLLYQMVSGTDARTFINIGRGFLTQSHASARISSIHPNAPYVEHAWGNDGQFLFYIAVDPVNARYYVDAPEYRYRKILYPMLARVLSAGRMNVIPVVMIVINWLAIAVGTLALAAWLRRQRLSPWWALLFGFYPGLSIALAWDLTEPLSYAFVTVAVYLYARGGRLQYYASPLSFALAGLTRDKAVLFGIFFGLGLLLAGTHAGDTSGLAHRLRENARHALPFLAITTLPLGIYALYLRYALRLTATSPTAQLGQPLSGLTAHALGNPTALAEIISVQAPAAICLVMAVWALWRRAWRMEVIGLIITIWISVVALNAKFFEFSAGATRTSIGVLLMALFCVPVFDSVGGKKRRWLWVVAGLWLLKDIAYVFEAPAWIIQHI